MADAPLVFEELRRRVSRPAIGYTLVAAAIVFWSVNAAVAKVVVDSGLSPLRLSEVRATGAGLVLMVAVAALRPRTLRLARSELGFLAIFGIAGLACVHFLYFTAITHLD